MIEFINGKALSAQHSPLELLDFLIMRFLVYCVSHHPDVFFSHLFRLLFPLSPLYPFAVDASRRIDVVRAEALWLVADGEARLECRLLYLGLKHRTISRLLNNVFCNLVSLMKRRCLRVDLGLIYLGTLHATCNLRQIRIVISGMHISIMIWTIRICCNMPCKSKMLAQSL